jgi:hypothetical protein
MNQNKSIPLYELFEQIAINGIELQRDNGSFPSGMNGPYEEDTTPVRNTANWLKTLSSVYNWTGNKKLRRAAESAARYLNSDTNRPYDYTFHCRTASGKDSCNGVVGQAIVIEAMSIASEYLNNPDILRTPKEIYRLHPFNESTGVWNRVEIDGRTLPVDRTFNHQLIFAAASSKLAEISDNTKIRADVRQFLENLPQNMAIDDSGVIIHRLRPTLALKDVIDILRDRRPELFLNPFLHMSEKVRLQRERRSKELGYQAVNLYWLANLKRRVPNHDVWKKISVDKMLDVTRKEYYRKLAETRSGWFGSIPPGFQLAHVINTFEDSPDSNELTYWTSMAINNHYDEVSGLFTKNCDDKETFSGMVYQAVNLPNITIEV